MNGLKEVGVEAVVKNLNGFLSGIRRMTSASENMSEGLLDIGASLSKMGVETFTDDILNIAGVLSAAGPEVGIFLSLIGGMGDKFKETTAKIKTFITQALKIAISVLKTLKDVVVRVINIALTPFKKAWDAITNTISRVVQIASGILIAGTIRKLGQAISEAGQAALEAGINFQTLTIRLEGLAARQALNEGMFDDFGDALAYASGKAEELLDWVVDLSLNAPISTGAIADTLTLATSYGLAEKEAKDMTYAVLNFASGMGLTDIAQRRIIENFGQMIQQEKITTMELRDMGRGAFVPLNDLLNRTAKILGMTEDEFDGTAASLNDFAKKKGLDPVKAAMQAFIDLSNQEFQGAIERMGSTIQGLRQRFKNLVNAIIGLDVLKPSLDLIGESIGNIFTAITEDEEFREIAQGIGDTLKGMTEDLLGDLPTVEEIVTTIKNAMLTVQTALDQIREGDLRGALETLGVPEEFFNFLDKIQGIVESDTVTTFVDNITTGLSNIKTFWENNKEPIIEASKIAIGEIADALGIEMPESPGSAFLKWTEDLDATTIVQKINDVKDALVKFIEKVEELPGKIEAALPKLYALAAAYLLVKRPLLAISLGLGYLLVKGAQAVNAMPEPENPVTPSGAPGYIPGSTTNSTTYNYNLSMNPSYSTVQSPATITDDISVLLSAGGP